MTFMNFLNSIPYDKLLHFAVCAVLGSLMKVVGIEWYFTLLVVMSVGVGKEIYDKVSKKGTPEWKDVLADFVGALVGVI